MKHTNRQDAIITFFTYAALILMAFITLVPFIWLIASTFKSNYEIVGVPGTFFPKKVTGEHYRYILGRFNILSYFFNSLFLAVVKTTVGCLHQSLQSDICLRNSLSSGKRPCIP